MNRPHSILPVVAGANGPLPVRKNFFPALLLLALLVALTALRLDAQEDSYVAIYGIIDQADSMNASNLTSQAHAKYLEAQQALSALQQKNPDWNAAMVSSRLKYLADKIAATIPVTNAAPVAPVVVPAPQPLVRLIAAGSEPRTVLRLHPKTGDQQNMTMTMKMAMGMSAAGKTIPAVNIPPMLMTMEVDVKDVSATGDITYGVVFNDATVAADTNVMPAMAAALKLSLAGLRGMTGAGSISSRGIIKDFAIKLPDGANPQLSQTLSQMKESLNGSATPLPEEAVGVGASWEYATQVKSQGMTIDQTATYELVSIDGNRLTLRSTLTQTAANQKIQNPAMPGLKMDLNQMTGTGTGGGTFDLTRIMPISATLAEDIDMNMGMNIGQQKQSMDMKMNLNMTMESK